MSYNFVNVINPQSKCECNEKKMSPNTQHFKILSNTINQSSHKNLLGTNTKPLVHRADDEDYRYALK